MYNGMVKFGSFLSAWAVRELGHLGSGTQIHLWIQSFRWIFLWVTTQCPFKEHNGMGFCTVGVEFQNTRQVRTGVVQKINMKLYGNSAL